MIINQRRICFEPNLPGDMENASTVMELYSTENASSLNEDAFSVDIFACQLDVSGGGGKGVRQCTLVRGIFGTKAN